MCRGNVQHNYSSLRDSFLVALQGMSLSISSHSVVPRRRPLCWVVSCGIISVVLCLTELYIYYIDVWELRKVRLYGDNPSVQQSLELRKNDIAGIDNGT